MPNYPLFKLSGADLMAEAQRMPQPADAAAMLRRCVMRLLICVATVSPLSDPPAHARERVYLTKADIERTLIGKRIVSRNLASGMVSNWEFHPDGRVDFANRSGPVSASGSWTLHADGLMCVTMVARTGCRFWFQQDGSFANADSKGPNAPAVAEVRFD